MVLYFILIKYFLQKSASDFTQGLYRCKISEISKQQKVDKEDWLKWLIPVVRDQEVYGELYITFSSISFATAFATILLALLIDLLIFFELVVPIDLTKVVMLRFNFA